MEPTERAEVTMATSGTCMPFFPRERERCLQPFSCTRQRRAQMTLPFTQDEVHRMELGERLLLSLAISSRKRMHPSGLSHRNNLVPVLHSPNTPPWTQKWDVLQLSASLEHWLGTTSTNPPQAAGAEMSIRVTGGERDLETSVSTISKYEKTPADTFRRSTYPAPSL